MRYFIAAIALVATAPALAADYHAHGPFKRYTMDSNPPRWVGGVIPWYYNPANQPADLDIHTIVATFDNAAKKWEDVCNVRFEYQGTTASVPNVDAANPSPDGKVVFGWAALTGSQQAYDGYTAWWWKIANTGPELFDADVVMNAAAGFNAKRLDDLDAAMTHELGHVLAIGHSDVQNSVMFATPYNTYDFVATLRGDDAAACASVYGASANAGVNRALNWAEQTFTKQLAPAGATSVDSGGQVSRYYPNTNSHVEVGVDGAVYYSAGGGAKRFLGTVQNYTGKATAAGF